MTQKRHTDDSDECRYETNLWINLLMLLGIDNKINKHIIKCGAITQKRFEEKIVDLKLTILIIQTVQTRSHQNELLWIIT